MVIHWFILIAQQRRRSRNVYYKQCWIFTGRLMPMCTCRSYAGLAGDAGNGAARQQVADFLRARYSDEIIWTRGTTEAINLVAQTWGAQTLRPGDEIRISHGASC